MFPKRLFGALLMLSPMILTAAAAQIAPDPDRGLYAIWTKPEISDSLDFLKGGQVILQWAQVEPSEGRYDFSALELQLEQIAKLGRVTTVQLNANRQPAYLSDRVPASPKTISKQQYRQGTLQYWHPAYIKAYTNVVAAFARAVKQSPNRSRVIGVRLSYDAIGTEFMIVPAADRDPSNWIAPAGVAPGPEWTEEIATAYRSSVVNAYIQAFAPEIRVFLRTGNALYRVPDPVSLRLAGTGNFGFFTTGSEIEPRMTTMYDGDKPLFIEYCRSGKIVCYAESMADAAGRHGQSQDPRWCSPEQYNYWRLLSDLNQGVSMLGIYGSDLAHADNPEYRAAFLFAARYAGYHASPTLAPGAWVALREGGPKLKGDYTFLMRRLPGADMKPERKAGPDDQRFGAWAMTLLSGSTVRFAPDPAFASSLAGKRASIKVTYLDQGSGRFTVRAGGKVFEKALGATGRWQTAAFEASGDLSSISLDATSDITLHMLEVNRE